MMISDKDLLYLRQAVNLAKKALDHGDQPFGALLVSKDGDVLFSDHNHVKDGDHTRHLEFEIAKWAMQNLSLEDRKLSTVYTSGEHCPMCAAAHGWANLERIVYASSTKQLVKWLSEFGLKPSNVKPLSLEMVLENTIIEGPVLSFESEIYNYHKAFYAPKKF